MNPPQALSIAGSDSGGGAGIQADLKTFAALEVYGVCAITAVTAQNTIGVDAIAPMDASFVAAQISSVLDDFSPTAVKTGMLANANIVEEVARWASRGELPTLVVDPVLVSTSGHTLFDENGIDAFRCHLLPQARIVTPNIGEAALLVGVDRSTITDLTAMMKVGRKLLELGPTVALVKGGHLHPGSQTGSTDVIVTKDRTSVLEAQRIVTGNDHGTGCTFSAAITALLARRVELFDAITQAKKYLTAVLEGAVTWRVGTGHGPVDHFLWTKRHRDAH